MTTIQVIRPKKKVELTFELTKNERNRDMLKLRDKEGRSTIICFDRIPKFVPSTLLARWFTHHHANELLRLAGKGSSVEYINYKEGEENTWKWREDMQYYGLHEVVTPKGIVRAVKIEDSIGMKSVVEIIEALGYTVETFFDQKTKRMVQINLIKEEHMYA